MVGIKGKTGKYKKSREHCEKIRLVRKGKKFEEIFGEERAKEMKDKMKKLARERTQPINSIIALKKANDERTGKKYEEIYGKERTQEILNKIKNKLKGKKFSQDTLLKMSYAASKRIMPLKDTRIEVKIQNFLKELKIEYYTHVYIKNIKNKYRCDIFIPSMNLIIECDGDYWHGNTQIFKKLSENQKKQKIKDDKRTKQLLEKGYRVLRLWEDNIKLMNLKDLQNKLEVIQKENLKWED